VAGNYEGTVLGLGIGCIEELLSDGFKDACMFITRCGAVSYVDRYDNKSPKEALGTIMLRSGIRRVWGHAAIFAWSDLISDRSRKVVGLQSPAACAMLAGGDSDPNFENDIFFNAQSPDTGRSIHARSWRANRDVSRVKCEGAIVGSVATWPLWGREKHSLPGCAWGTGARCTACTAH